jgi:hypothetical protein
MKNQNIQTEIDASYLYGILAARRRSQCSRDISPDE